MEKLAISNLSHPGKESPWLTPGYRGDEEPQRTEPPRSSRPTRTDFFPPAVTRPRNVMGSRGVERLCSTFAESPGGLMLFFLAVDPNTGAELWTSDGTTSGTRLVKDIFPGDMSSAPSQMFAPDDDGFYFAGIDSNVGAELYFSDGTEDGTTFVADIAEGSSNSLPSTFARLGGEAFFSATDESVGREPFVTDGTNEPVLLRDIFPNGDSNPAREPGAPPDMPSSLASLGDEVLFAATDPDRGRELWKSDGTPTGTVRVTDLAPGTVSSRPEDFAVLGSQAFFRAFNPATGSELYGSDGTEAGTSLVTDLIVGPDSGFPEVLTVAGDRLFFIAEDPDFDRELFVSDGTEAGTELVADINSGGDADISEIAAFGERVLFAADEGTQGRELWISDGSANGTQLVFNIAPDIGGVITSSEPRDFTVVDDRVFFTADNFAQGRELWVTDGTMDGTRLVKDINNGLDGSSPQSLTADEGRLFFVANDGMRGFELWISDGTEGGTELVKDIDPGGSSNPDQLFSFPPEEAEGPAPQDVFRFFNTNAGGHFFTISEAERDSAANIPGFNAEGVEFEAFPENEAPAEAVPVFRFFNTEAKGHFFTTSTDERDFVEQNLPRFEFEGVGFEAFDTQVEDTVPVYRLFNMEAGGHFFTTSENERDDAAALDAFTPEGIGFFAFPADFEDSGMSGMTMAETGPSGADPIA
ncbi:MAG: hypothetical protein GVY13_09200 [Alphaproteobacteria bacterium]|nr:hypothetical protein [Alphaproteobacteria bacterium]